MNESAGELLRRVDHALDAHAHADQTTRIVESLTNLEKGLSPYLGDLSQTVAAFSTLDLVGISTERPDTRSLASACRQAAEMVRQDKSGPQDLHRTLRDISSVVNTSKSTARDSWREFIDARVPGLDGLNDLAGMLGQMGADKVQVANLRNAVTGLRNLSRHLPDSSAPRQATAAVDVIYPALTVLLGDSNAHGDIREFMDSVARGGAHVRTLTSAVKEWMRRSGVEDSFKIVAGRPASE
jgi:hypothetical protein